LHAGGRGFESGHTRSVGARAKTVSRAAGGASVCRDVLRSADAVRNLAAAPLAENFHGVPGNVPKAVALFRIGRTDYGVRLRAWRTSGALRPRLGGRAACGRLPAKSAPARA